MTLFRIAMSAVICGAVALGPAVAGGNKPDCTNFDIDSKASTALRHVKPAATCQTQTRNGYPVPDPNCTPGAINPRLTVAVLRNPDFRTACVRDNATSAKQKASTYVAYGIPHPDDNRGVAQICELDHLISLELSGADTLDNIWPQCGPDGVVLRERYFKQKDMVENYLAREVRDGNMSLEEAQKGIAADWTQYLEAARAACRSASCRVTARQ